MTNYKIDRISSDILKYLNGIFLTECRDELFKTITLTDVNVTKDLGYAKVYFTSFSNLSHNDIEKELNNAASFLRRKLAKVLEIRNIPELHFVYDESIEQAQKLENIIASIHKDDNE